mgnify:FL=1|tara:strand:- start:1040 stop:1486 length:447 start_codon:yes stop_codon:yes gene_type:complete
MAITYTNHLDVDILSPLQEILNGEFTQAVSFDTDYVARGTNWFNLVPVSDNTLEELSNGHIREYEILVQYYRILSGQSRKDTHIDATSNVIERFKRLIRNNTSYSDSNGQRFFNGRLESINYQPDNADLSSDIGLVETTFIANVFEVV